MPGLKELWNLGEASALDPAVLQKIEHGKRALLDAIERLNEQLKYTAANAPPASHAPLAKLRDDLFSRYQNAVAQIAEADAGAPGEADAGDSKSGDLDVLDELVVRAKKINSEAEKLAKNSRELKQRWEQQAPTLESTEDAIAQNPDGANGAFADVQQRLDRVVEAAGGRDYQTALDELKAAEDATKKLSTASAGTSPAETAPGPDGVNEQRYDLDGPLGKLPPGPSSRRELDRWQNPLIERDPRELFKPDRMDDVADMHFEGEGDAKLNEAMEGILFGDPADEAKHLAIIAEQRGLKPEEMKGQLARFRQLQEVAKQNGEARGLKPDEVMTEQGTEKYLEKYGDFLGTRSSLRFGQVVGEATGLDPAFAALLNPTGGMVGPGMEVLAPTDANSPVILHGIFHDAGGYLLNYQNAGPGYTYLEDMQPESGRRGSDAFQGQLEGISYWYERRDPDRSVFEDLYALDGEQMAYDAYVRQPIDDAEAIADGLTEDAVDEVRELTAEVRQFNQQSVETLTGAAHSAGDGVQEEIAEASESLDRMAGVARDLGVDAEVVDSAQTAIHDHLQSADQQVEAWEREMSAAFDSVAHDIEGKLTDIETWADEAGVVMRESVRQLGAVVEQTTHEGLIALQSEGFVDQARHLANSVLEKKQDVEGLAVTIQQDIESAKARAEEFYNDAIKSIEPRAKQAADKLVGVKNDLIEKLDEAERAASAAVYSVQQNVNAVAGGLGGAGQDLIDAARGIPDSLAGAVSSGTDTFANAVGSATDFAAERFNRLTNLLG